MPIPPATIVTARLDLIPLRIADADEMVGVLADPVLYAFIGGEPPTRSELARRYRAQVRGRSADGREAWHNWIVRERSTGEATGFVQATVVDGHDGHDGHDGRQADIAWLIGVPWQGRGHATEAAVGLVNWLAAVGVAVVTAHVHPDHAASATVAARAGLDPTDELVDGERVWRRRFSAADRTS